MNNIYPGTPDCPWPARYTVWNRSDTFPETTEPCIVTDGSRVQEAFFFSGQWRDHTLLCVTGWRFKAVKKEDFVSVPLTPPNSPRVEAIKREEAVFKRSFEDKR